jgi:hypothetical protein
MSNTFAGWLAALDHAEGEVQALLNPPEVPA